VADSRTDELHKWVGYSITAWAKVEEGLFELCWRSLGSSEERAAIVYFRIPGINGRIQLVDELVKTVLPKPERKDGGHSHTDIEAWEKLRKRIVTNELPTRRRIAHHPAGYRKVRFEFRPTSTELPREPEPGAVHFSVAHEVGESSRPEIYQSEAETLSGKSVDVVSLNIGEVRSYSERVSNLADELQNFVKNNFLKYIG
jgi:hypothetical protein